MAAFLHEEDHETFLVCSICEEDFKEPVELPCLHSFCKKCLSQHIVDTTEGHTSPRGFKCPKCKRMITVPNSYQLSEHWAESFPVNHFVKSLTDEVKSRNENRKCDPCLRRNDRIMATRWCTDCSEAYCEHCESVHTSLKYSQHHKMISMDELCQRPLKETISRPYCPDHQGTELSFFCEDHHQVVCSVCVTLDHRKCQHIVSCKEAYDKIRMKTNALIDKLKMQRDWSCRIKENRKHSSKTLQESSFQLQQQIAGLRQQLEDLLRSKENELKEEIESVNKSKTTLYESNIDVCEGITSSTDNALSLLQNALKYGSDTDVLLISNKVMQESQICENTLADLTREMKDVFINFEPDKDLQTLKNALKDIGKVTVTYMPVHIASPYNLTDTINQNSFEIRASATNPISTSSSQQPQTHRTAWQIHSPTGPRTSTPSPKGQENRLYTTRSSPMTTVRSSRKSQQKSERNDPTPLQPLVLPSTSTTPRELQAVSKQATLESFFKGRTIHDRENSCFTGSEFINDRIVLGDQNNRKLKLFDSEYKWLGEKVLSAKPYDLVTLNGEEVAVTFPSAKQVQIFQVRSTDFLCMSTIQTGSRCWGIAFENRKFAIGCHSNLSCVKLMSRDGRELKVISKDTTGQDLFAFPDYIAMDKSGKNLYITDRYKKNVLAITSSGEKRWEFKDESVLQNPKGISVFGTHVYVAGCKSHNVLQLTTEGDVIGVILNDGISSPHKICLHPGGDNLMITQFQPMLVDVEKNMVKFFTIY